MILTATAAYPYPGGRDRAALGLRDELREAAAVAGQDPNWSTVIWYGWTATVDAAPAGLGSCAR